MEGIYKGMGPENRTVKEVQKFFRDPLKVKIFKASPKATANNDRNAP